MKKLIIFILYLISRVIYSLIPKEFKKKKNIYDIHSKIIEYSSNETFEHFKNDLKRSVLFTDIREIRKYAIKNALLNDKNLEFFYLEFGTYRGASCNMFSQYVKKFYTFDSFEGLSTDWAGKFDKPKGSYTSNKKLPKLNSNVEPVIGWVEDTLDVFLDTHKPKINFIHFDMDIYEPTKFTLLKVKPYLLKNAILIFDDFYNYFGWDQGEYKALMEVFSKNEFEYKAFAVNGKRCVIQVK